MPMGYTTSSSVPGYQQSPMTRLGYFNENTTRQPNSPESISSSSPPTPSPPPPSASAVNNTMFNNNNGQVLTTQAIDTELITPLVPSSTPVLTKSSSTPTNGSNRFNNPTTARVKEMITRANSVPMEFYHTEFLEYSKETYEKKMESKRNKRKRPQPQDDEYQPYQSSSKRKKTFADEESEEEDVEEEESNEKMEE
jgi:hypothetical protein